MIIFNLYFFEETTDALAISRKVTFFSLLHCSLPGLIWAIRGLLEAQVAFKLFVLLFQNAVLKMKIL